MKYLYAVAAAAMVSTPAMAATNIVTNGGFEQPGVTGTCCTTSPSDPLPGWTVGSGNVNVVLGTFGSTNGNLAYEATQYLDLIGQGGSGSISQSLATVVGQSYKLTFAYAHNLFPGGTNAASAGFAFGGLTGTVSHSSGSTNDLDWQIYTGYFTATSTSTNLSFTNLTPTVGNAGVLLDGISVSAVPEPATWAMMIAGFGLVGGTMRRSRRKTTVAYA